MAELDLNLLYVLVALEAGLQRHDTKAGLRQSAGYPAPGTGLVSEAVQQ